MVTITAHFSMSRGNPHTRSTTKIDAKVNHRMRLFAEDDNPQSCLLKRHGYLFETLDGPVANRPSRSKLHHAEGLIETNPGFPQQAVGREPFILAEVYFRRAVVDGYLRDLCVRIDYVRVGPRFILEDEGFVEALTWCA